MELRRRRPLAAAQLIMLGLAGFSALSAAYAFMSQLSFLQGVLPNDRLPVWLQERWSSLTGAASAPVRVHPSHWTGSATALSGFSGNGYAPKNWAEYAGGSRVGVLTFWDPGAVRLCLWAVAAAAPWIVLTLIWLLLARIVQAARAGDPFTIRAASQLRIIGLLLLVGPYLLAVAIYGLRVWMLSASTVSGKVDVVSPWAAMLLWPLGVGVGLLALTAVWRVGVGIGNDVDGLV